MIPDYRRFIEFVVLTFCLCVFSSYSSSASDILRGIPHLGGSACTKLQHEVQKGIISHKWGLENLKFQQRLKRHPKYIVTVQQIRPMHEPLVELRCPGGSGPHYKGTPNLEFYFHETQFQAESVRLFDIHSIFPIQTGRMNVRIKLDPLVVKLDKLSDAVGNSQFPSANDVYFAQPSGNTDFAKEHREDAGEALLDLEREIESVFINRIQPDVQNQLRNVVTNTVRKYFAQNLVRF